MSIHDLVEAVARADDEMKAQAAEAEHARAAMYLELIARLADGKPGKADTPAAVRSILSAVAKSPDDLAADVAEAKRVAALRAEAAKVPGILAESDALVGRRIKSVEQLRDAVRWFAREWLATGQGIEAVRERTDAALRSAAALAEAGVADFGAADLQRLTGSATLAGMWSSAVAMAADRVVEDSGTRLGDAHAATWGAWRAAQWSRVWAESDRMIDAGWEAVTAGGRAAFDRRTAEAMAMDRGREVAQGIRVAIMNADAALRACRLWAEPIIARAPGGADRKAAAAAVEAVEAHVRELDALAVRLLPEAEAGVTPARRDEMLSEVRALAGKLPSGRWG
jgi:hypothetical protein